MSMPAAIAASAPPPAVNTVKAANCAAPENTISDIITGAIEPMTGCASTPNEIPPAKVGSTSARPARTPVRSSLDSRTAPTLPYTHMQVVTTDPETIKLLGGSLALDFANSVDWTEADEELPATDALLPPDSLDRWGARLGVAGRPGGPEELELARGLRTALHMLFSALARDEPPDQFSLARLRFAYAQAVANGTLIAREEGGFGLDWSPDEFRRVRFGVAAAAVDLLRAPARLARLHRCPGRACGWIFLDTSGRRRWCSMATCGSREKMRRMYARKRAALEDA